MKTELTCSLIFTSEWIRSTSISVHTTPNSLFAMSATTRAWIRRDEIWGVYPDEDFH